MTWNSLSWQDWRRRPLRMSVTTLGVAIAIAALWSLLAFGRGYQGAMQGELERLGAHVLVVPKGCPYDAASIALHGASWPCYLRQDYLKQVRAVPAVAVAAPVFMAALNDDATAIGVLLAFAASRGIETWLRGRLPFTPDDTLIRWEWTTAGACLACALVLGSVCGLLPAWRAARLSPVVAMRSPDGAGGRA